MNLLKKSKILQNFLQYAKSLELHCLVDNVLGSLVDLVDFP